MSLKLRRGTNTERLTFTPEVGELIYTTDTKQLYAGDGSTPGGTLVSYNGSLEGPLGGNLILNGNNITGTGNINITGTITSSGNITTQGNVVVQGNITLGNESADSISLGGEVNSDIIPKINNNYDLGSSTKRWDTIHANNVFADLEGNVRAADSTILVDAASGVLRGTLQGSVSNPGQTAVQGNVIGNVEGDLTGSVRAPNNTVIVDAGTDGTDAVFYGTFIGTLDGPVDGVVLLAGTYSNPSFIQSLDANKIFGTLTNVYLDGDMEGSVFANDSTMLVDGNNGVLRGTHIGNLEGSVYTGDITLTGSNIFADTGSNINISTQALDKIVLATGTIELSSNTVTISGSVNSSSITIGNDPATNRLIITHSANTSQPFTTFGAYNNSSSSSGTGAAAIFSRARGTPSLPTALQAGDEIATLVFAGNTNAPIPDFRDAANIMAKAVSVSAGNFVEGRLEFRTTNSSGTTSTKLAINGDGSLEMTDSLLVVGPNPGNVDNTGPVKFVKVFLGSTAYAMPLYAIR